MGRRDSSGGLTQFHYALPSKPWLVTHVYQVQYSPLIGHCSKYLPIIGQPRESRVTSLVYDETDRLIFVKINQVSKMGICDTKKP